MGNGSANVEVETFSGDVELIRASELKPAKVEDEHEERSTKMKIKPKVKMPGHEPDQDRDQEEDR
jgi:hypothetical protein